jgi:hypothetical protein
MESALELHKAQLARAVEYSTALEARVAALEAALTAGAPGGGAGAAGPTPAPAGAAAAPALVLPGLLTAGSGEVASALQQQAGAAIGAPPPLAVAAVGPPAWAAGAPPPLSAPLPLLAPLFQGGASPGPGSGATGAGPAGAPGAPGPVQRLLAGAPLPAAGEGAPLAPADPERYRASVAAVQEFVERHHLRALLQTGALRGGVGGAVWKKG